MVGGYQGNARASRHRAGYRHTRRLQRRGPHLVALAAIWAKVVERGGREPLLADRPVMLVSYEVTIRTGIPATHKDRVKWCGKTLTIDTVTPVPGRG